MKKIVLTVVFIMIAIYLVLTSYFPNTEINKYDSLETVKAQNIIEKGWIPEILPPSAYNIVETHDIDTNKVFGKFSYKESDEVEFLSKLTDANGIYEGEHFLFKIDKEKNRVDFRNKI